jgi:SOS-response transcriptional repressor LexA
MTNPITKRFVECHDLLKSSGVIKSSATFAEQLNTHRQTLNEILKGRRSVKIEMIQLAIEKYYFNPYYIFSGSGEKFVNPELDSKEIVNNITLVPVKAQAGYGDQMLDPVYKESLERFMLPIPKFSQGEYFAFEVEGESMYPTLEDGELVICSRLDPNYYTHTIKDDQMYVFVTPDEVLVKRAINKLYRNDIITLQSDNPDYPDINMKASKLKEVWKVEGVFKTSLGKPNIKQHSTEEIKEMLVELMEKSKRY